ncbi:MAG TPA: oligosaccharide flippase family protein [Verrucomicrobiae bacterium]|jgi:O-antigen/teichoic acid export membrane protein
MNFSTLRPRGFLKNVFLVMSGTAVAQAIGFLVSPVLTRLYSPSDFGLAACYLSIVAVISAGVTLQYPQALIIPGDARKAGLLFLASCIATIGIALLVLLLCVTLPGFFSSVFKASGFGRLIYLVPLGILITGINQTFIAWCLRKKAFGYTAKAQVASSLTKSVAQICGGFVGLGAGGFIIGSMLGDAAVNLLLLRRIVRDDGPMLGESLRSGEVLAASREYKDFPLYSTPQNVLNAVSAGAPVILLSHYYGIAVGGFYAFATRILEAPMRLALGSLRQVLFQKISEINNKGDELTPIFGKCTNGLFLGVIGPAVIGFIFAPRVFALVFGKQWYEAGEYAQWLLVWFIPAFCNLPAALVLRVLRYQRSLLVFDSALLVGRVLVLVIGTACKASPLATIIAFSCLGAAFEAWLIWYGWRVLRSRCSMATEFSPVPSIDC